MAKQIPLITEEQSLNLPRNGLSNTIRHLEELCHFAPDHTLLALVQEQQAMVRAMLGNENVLAFQLSLAGDALSHTNDLWAVFNYDKNITPRVALNTLRRLYGPCD